MCCDKFLIKNTGVTRSSRSSVTRYDLLENLQVGTQVTMDSERCFAEISICSHDGMRYSFLASQPLYSLYTCLSKLFTVTIPRVSHKEISVLQDWLN